ncbi:MAG: MarR family transcriptional regulator, partial [Flavobacteriaceae bacterium]|nr:MarR family transcriptional regulator [Flavobacteriaceae bacterium]
MSHSVFRLDDYDKHISSKIVMALARVSQSFKQLLWEKAKITGLSPIQIQILLFLEHHHTSLATVSYLAKELTVTKATLSDAVKALHQKKLVRKKYNQTDRRSYQLILTGKGKTLVLELDNFADPIKDIVATKNESDLYFFYKTLNSLLAGLHDNQILQVQRSCSSCSYFDSNSYCKL